MEMKMTKRMTAWLLAVLMVIVAVPSVQAANAKPKFSTQTAEVEVGKTLTLKVKNKPSKATYKWSSTNSKVAKVTQKGVVKGIKRGSATITCTIKTQKTKTKKAKTYVLTKEITVKQFKDVVSSQSALKKALKNPDLETLEIKTKKAVLFDIPKGDYSNVHLVVNAPNADVKNKGTFASVTIQAIKADTWTEMANGNQFSISALNARMIIDKNASVASIEVTQSGSKFNLEVNGTLDKLIVRALCDLNISGTADKINIIVEAGAEGTTITANIPVIIEAACQINVVLEKGAEGSSVKLTGENGSVKLDNHTSEMVVVSSDKGERKIASGSSATLDTKTLNTPIVTPTYIPYVPSVTPAPPTTAPAPTTAEAPAATSEAPTPAPTTAEAPAATSEAPTVSEAPAATSPAPTPSEAPAATSPAPTPSEAPAPTTVAP